MLRIAIIGATGYAGAEVVRLLTGHPHAALTYLTASGEREGKLLGDLYPSLRGCVDLTCRAVDIAAVAESADVCFIALSHGAMDYAPPLLERGVKVIDLGAEFRLKDAAAFEQWYKKPHTCPRLLERAVYGLPELFREQIRAAQLVANPGCYPTSAILPLYPLLERGMIDPTTIIVDSASGVSGAGRSKTTVDYLFSEVNEDFKAYNVAAHRHTPEIEQALSWAAGAPVTVTFTAHLLPITRGILTTTYATLVQRISTADVLAALHERYANEPFIRIYPEGELPQVKFATGSNFCDIGAKVDPRTNRVILISAEDNLIKGAAGQAVQNMTVMCGLDETTGLRTPPIFP
ncbi:MAG: N-acetyl-gamma-glutamyl-phosphate reductase [Abditibacteriales bacterium]|nr:N-acetyl-gamma-glutamyl-phosphate reductase [Abditibacteriales bacterium]MDW8367741.1 N-acetyl-gamma-glutamyl-phosphate reductase [Abditibacteriales bacterium]